MPSSDPYHVPARLRSRAAEISARTDAIAREHLDEEYADLARRMIAALARKRPSPIERGEVRSLAAGVLHAIGTVNFLSDRTREQHLTMKELAVAAGVGPSTIDRMSGTIRDALDLFPMHPEWTRPSDLLDNPMVGMVKVGDFVLDLREAPREVQEEAFRNGLIPVVPADRTTTPAPEPRLEQEQPFQITADRPASTHPGQQHDLFTGDTDPNASRPEVLGELELVLARTLHANPGATIEELNAALAGAADDYNRQPQTELGGLSPRQVQALLSADWESSDGAIRLDASLTPEALAHAPVLQDAMLLIAMLSERTRVKATPKGNLPREFVREFRDRMRTGDRWDGIYPGIQVHVEADLLALHLTRVLLSLGRIVRLTNRWFQLTKRGMTFAAGDRQGALFAELFRIHFRKLNLDWLDRAAHAEGLQETIAFTIHQFGRTGGDWRKPEELTGTLLLPIVRDAVPPPSPLTPGFDEVALILETRVLRPLVRFGLAESRQAKRGPGVPYEHDSYRKSPLFDRFLSFDLERP